MNWLAIAAKWFGLALAALSFGWTVGGHVDLVSLAGVIGLVVWRLAQLLIDSGRWGAGLPAGESGSAGRGTVGTDAPTGRLSPLVRVTAVVYAVVGIAIAAVAVALAPWGLLLLVFSLAVLAVAFLLWLMAEGFAAMEADEWGASIGKVVRNAHRISVDELGENLDGSPERIELGPVVQADLLVEIAFHRLPDEVLLALKARLDRGENVGCTGAVAHGETVPGGGRS